mmetsp:Transcript_64443/g.185201  ORF Transcript_64443/g.185201 Transcript_64443/m.185201 type:complete len:324 (+) Transcript_64443:2-973(+)
MASVSGAPKASTAQRRRRCDGFCGEIPRHVGAHLGGCRVGRRGDRPHRRRGADVLARIGRRAGWPPTHRLPKATLRGRVRRRGGGGALYRGGIIGVATTRGCANDRRRPGGAGARRGARVAAHARPPAGVAGGRHAQRHGAAESALRGGARGALQGGERAHRGGGGAKEREGEGGEGGRKGDGGGPLSGRPRRVIAPRAPADARPCKRRVSRVAARYVVLEGGVVAHRCCEHLLGSGEGLGAPGHLGRGDIEGGPTRGLLPAQHEEVDARVQHGQPGPWILSTREGRATAVVHDEGEEARVRRGGAEEGRGGQTAPRGRSEGA